MAFNFVSQIKTIRERNEKAAAEAKSNFKFKSLTDQKPKPHILLILVDDLGFADIAKVGNIIKFIIYYYNYLIINLFLFFYLVAFEVFRVLTLIYVN